MDDLLIESLLHEEESSTLDFKEKQYRFEGEDDRVKSELLKDILAFANSWKRSDSYILIGVKEVKGSRSEVVGIDHHIDDAQLQQFVNSKTQNPLTFAYKAQHFQGKQIGVIWIPVQTKPVYLKKEYGKLKDNIVYIRRGSATDEAKPDEIARMGSEDVPSINLREPILKVYFSTSRAKQTDVLQISSIEPPEQNAVVNQLNKLLISDEDMSTIESHKNELDEIADQLPNGKIYHPYKVDKVIQYINYVEDAIKLASSDIMEFLKRYNLSTRSLELSNSHYATFKQRNSNLPTYVKLFISNEGFSPSENIVVYIDSNDKVEFLTSERFRAYDITFHLGILDGIKKTIDRAQLISKQKKTDNKYAVNKLRAAMFEASSRPFIERNFISNLLPSEKRIICKIEDDRLKIKINDGLMHNHHMIIDADNIYLCPYLSKGEKTKITYECHANNLPIPTTGFLTIEGV